MSADTGPVVLALDLGSSSVRATFHDREGTPLAGTRVAVAVDLCTRPAGASTLDASAARRAVEAAIDGTLARLPAGARVLAVGQSCMWHSLLGVDEAGEPLTPLFSWADRRAAAQAARLRLVLDEIEVHRRSGCRLHSSYPLARLCWLQAEQPELCRRVARWVSLAELTLHAFTGCWRVSPSLASGSGLLDLAARQWDPSLLAVAGLQPARLSPVDAAPVAGLRSPYRERWPALAEVPWLPATGDGACANLGAGAVGPERLGLTLGTSGALRRLLPVRGSARTLAPPGAALWRYWAGGSRLVEGGALSDAGNVFAWMRRTLALPAPAVLEAELGAMAPDAHGLTFVPRFAGERGPSWSDEGGGVIAGLSLATRPLELWRAALEAVALRLMLIARELGGPPGPVVASGAALLGSPTWQQIVADALGRPLVIGPHEASSRGAALLALEAIGLLPDAARVPAPPGAVIEPVPAHHDRYRAALQRQLALLSALPVET